MSTTKKTTFQKGQSGNPGGRSPRIGPNGESLTELCRGKTVDCVNALYNIAMSVQSENKDRIAACFGLLDRGWGKPKESIDLDAKVEGNNLPIIQIVRYGDKPEGS